MPIEIIEEVDPVREQQAWEMYEETFREINALAVQRHLMFRQEFDAVMADKRVQKYLYTPAGSPGELAGLSTFTRDLDSMPLISPAYFNRRWPDLYTDRRIFYCGFVGVAPHAQASVAFREMVEAMWRTAVAVDGIIVLDICDVNETVRSLDKVIPLMLKRLARPEGRAVIATRLDTQTYWEYEFPQVGM
jgi:hypothetical protein